MTKKNDQSKETLEVVRAALALAERDEILGLVTAEQVLKISRTRFAPANRKQLAALLKAEGKSNREIGGELGVAHTTVAADLGKKRRGANAPKNGADAPPDDASHKARRPSSTPPLHHPDDPIQEPCPDCTTPEETWQRSLGNLAGDAVSIRAYWTRQFGDWEKFQISSDLVLLAKQAAEAWSQLASDLSKRRSS